MKLLRKYLPKHIELKTHEDFGISNNFKEVMAFALLGTGSAVIKSFSPQLGGTLVAHAVVDENTYPPLIFAQAHVQSKGWMEPRYAVGTNSLMIGTTGQALRLEKIKLGLVDTSDRDNWKTVTGEFVINAHINIKRYL